MFNIIINVKQSNLAALPALQQQLKLAFPDSEIVAYTIDAFIWLTQENQPQHNFSLRDLMDYCGSSYDFLFVNSELSHDLIHSELFSTDTQDKSVLLITSKHKVFKLLQDDARLCAQFTLYDIDAMVNRLITSNSTLEIIDENGDIEGDQYSQVAIQFRQNHMAITGA